MNRYLKAVIVMRSAQDIQLDQYVNDCAGEDHVAKVTFPEGAIDVAFEQVALWFRDRIARIESERIAEEQARLRDAEISAGVNVICGRESLEDPHGEDLMGPITPTQFAVELIALLRAATGEFDDLPTNTRERVADIAARIGSRQLRERAR